MGARKRPLDDRASARGRRIELARRFAIEFGKLEGSGLREAPGPVGRLAREPDLAEAMALARRLRDEARRLRGGGRPS